jgi:hypothetical protein
VGDSGLAVNAWVVALHNSRLGMAHPDLTLENAFGDRYRHALCPSQPDVRTYACALATDVCRRHELQGIELEACGFMGFEHLSHHEKVAVPPDELRELLLSVCFCTACVAGLRAEGLDPEQLRRAARRSIEEFFASPARAVAGVDAVEEELERMLGADVAALRGFRERVELTLLEDVVAAARAERRLRVVVNTSPSRNRGGAGITSSPAALAQKVDQLLVSVWTPDAANATDSIARIAREVDGHARVVAGLRAYPPDLTSAGGLAERCQALVTAGATDFRFYHYGLCPRDNLQWIAAAIAATKAREGAPL